MVSYPIQQQSDGALIDEKIWNDNVDALNDLNTRTTAAKSTADAASTTNTAQDTRLTALETNQGTRGSLAAIYPEIQNLRNVALSGNTGNAALDTRVTALEGAGLLPYSGGRWVNTSDGVPVAQNAKVPFPTNRTTATGVTANANFDTFTVTNAGRYDVSANIHFNAPTANTTMWAWIGRGGSVDPRWSLNVIPISVSGFYAFAVSTLNLTLTANDTVSVYVWYSAGTVTVNPTGTGFREATNFAIRRVG
ncbi:hypothetical protein [Amycolatopsis minnesotensis]|uniref:C1q domain-containing protein n=1 Tax=Amycolatopsis minnesotensis TaxID=337894 RepID=A0ABN2Q0Q3_9PSEU